MKKTTKKENFMVIIGILEELGRADLVEVMQHEVELLDKKKASGKLTKTQEANEDIKALILKELATVEKPLSITELLNKSEALKKATNGSNQKVSALMTQLKNANKVIREQEGKKAVFKIAPNEDSEEIQEDEEE